MRNNPILIVDTTDMVKPIPWSEREAKRLIRVQIRALRGAAKNLADNIDDYSADEEQFFLGLTQGAGYDPEGVAELIELAKKLD